MTLRLALLLLFPLGAFAHPGEPLAPHDIATAWVVDPGTVIPLALWAFLYARGARVSRGIPAGRQWCYWVGWVCLAVALVSPLHPLGESLFFAHMVQHEILMLAAAPLLVLSRPLVPLLWGLPMPWRRSLGKWSKARTTQNLWRMLTAPLCAWIVHALAIWIWHAPALFEATLASDFVHALQHLSFFLSALLFWWSLFYARGRSSYGAGILYLFTTAVHTSILGALLTFARSPWYPAYELSARRWDYSALEDQQIGGLIMWVPATTVYLAAMLFMLGAWIRESDRQVSEEGSYAG